MKKLLVVGDSYMAPDPRHPNTHWTELVDNFEVVNFAWPGLTNALIFRRLIEGMNCKPDIVLIWFTESKRIEFENKTAAHLLDYVTDCNEEALTKDQLMLLKHYFINTPEKLMDLTNSLTILGALSFLKHINANFLFSYGMFEERIAYVEPYIKQSLLMFNEHHFKEIFNRGTGFTNDPSYHTDYDQQIWLKNTICERLSKL